MALKAIINVDLFDDTTNDTKVDYSVRIYEWNNGKVTLKNEQSLDEVSLKGIETLLLNIPSKLLNFRILSLPALDRKKLLEVVPFELESNILIDPQGIVYDLLTDEPTDGNVNTLVVYISKETLAKLLGPLKKMGISPTVMTSLDVRSALSKGIGSFVDEIFNQRPLSKEETMRFEAEELQSPIISLSDRDMNIYALKSKYLRPLTTTSILLLALLMGLTVWFSLGAFLAHKEALSMKKDLESQYKRLFPEDKRVSNVTLQLQSKIKTIKNHVDTLIGLDPNQLLIEFSKAKTEGILVNDLEVTKHKVKIIGESKGVDAIESFKRGLTWLQGLEVTGVTEGARGLYNFSMTGRVKDSR